VKCFHYLWFIKQKDIAMNEEQLHFFNSVIRPRLIQMALDGDPALSDLNELSSAHFEDMAKRYNDSDEVVHGQAIEKLGHYVSEDPEYSFHRLLVANDDDMADDHVLMWQPLEGKYTVRQLLEMIGI
jgi:hypothetical protein